MTTTLTGSGLRSGLRLATRFAWFFGAIAFVQGPALAQQPTGPEPSIYQPVAPRVLETDLGTEAARFAAPAWKAGERVRVIEDLKGGGWPDPGRGGTGRAPRVPL